MNLKIPPFLEKINLRGYLSPKPSVSHGLDIGASGIKLVSLLKSKESVKVEKCLLAVNNSLPDSLVKFIEGSGIKGSGVNVSVSGQEVICRYILMPLMKAEELKSALVFEAEKHIPFPINECVIDGAILKTGLPESKMLVLIAAVKKNVLAERIKLVEQSGLSVNSVDVDTVAVINAFQERFLAAQKDKMETKLYALLNIGASVSSFSVISEGIPRFSRRINVGGDDFTKKISAAFSLDFPGAEGLKLSPGEKLDAVMASVEPVVSGLANEIRLSLDYFESRSVTGVERIFLSGGGSSFARLDGNLKQVLDIEFAYWSPLEGLEFANDAARNEAEKHRNKLDVAIGLALK